MQKKRYSPLPWAGLLLVLGLLSPAIVRAQGFALHAGVDATTIREGEVVSFRVTVEGAGFSDVQTPDPPATQLLEPLSVLPSTQRSVSSINGDVRQSITFVWSFRATGVGTGRIEPVSVSVRGNTLSSEAIAVRILPGAAPQTPGQTPPDDEPELAADDLFIRAIPSARRVYQGEQVTVEYHLFYREGVQLRQSRLADSWDAKGFWREEFEIDTRPIPRIVREGDRRYDTILLKRVALFPTRSGELSVDPLRIETDAYVPYRRDDPFSFRITPNLHRAVRLSSPAITISTRALPSGAPASFQGAVGDFTMEVQSNRTGVRVGEPVEVTVAVSGTGNLATIASPDLNPPGAFERYAPRVDLTIDRTGEQISGRKTFTYVLVPRSNGSFEVPGLQFAFFSPTRERYVELTSPNLSVTVTGEPSGEVATGLTASGLPVDDIGGLLSNEAGWEQTDVPPLHRQPWPYVALTLPFLLVIAVLVYRRVDRTVGSDPERRKRQATPFARRHLKQAAGLFKSGDAHGFYLEIERALLGFLGERLGMPGTGQTRAGIRAKLYSAGAPESLWQRVEYCLDVCDAARFAPQTPDPERMRETLREAEALLHRLDAVLPADSPRGRRP